MSMGDFWGDLAKRVQELSSHWSAYTVLGSFALYVLGYLTLRFHLTALGVGVDLSVLDERYLFTGTKFLIYIIASIPSLIFLVVFIAAPVYLIFRVLPSFVRVKLGDFLSIRGKEIQSWWLTSNRLVLSGLLFCLLIIQLVMRQCFLLSNLLLAEDLPTKPTWLRDLLLAKTDGPMALYFSALLAGAAITIGIFYYVRHSSENTTASAALLTWLLGFLIFVQLLLLPVNYGILVVDKSMPRVTALDDSRVLQANEQAWLVWEGSTGKTFLLRKQQAGKYAKSLITLPLEDVKKLEITGYDRIFEVIFDLPRPQFSDSKDST